MSVKCMEVEFFELRTLIANMVNITQSMFEDAIKAMIEQNADLVTDVFNRDAEVDCLDLQIDDRCLLCLKTALIVLNRF